ncbi:hypothetical protein ABW19_dt0203452 [Dactylella cylindrospora]|nr:hypothetical protein ABW19_dt0203452 [Dactylella cylindrospora]
MSEPTEEPLQERADIPVQRLSRPDSTRATSRKKRPTFTVQASSDFNDDIFSLSTPSRAVTRPESPPGEPATLPTGASPDVPQAHLDGSSSNVGAVPQPNLAEPLQEGDIDAELNGGQRGRFKSRFNRLGQNDPYAPSSWNRFTTNARTSGYAVKIFAYKGVVGFWHLPEHIVRSWRRFANNKPATPTVRLAVVPAPPLILDPADPPSGERVKESKRRKVAKWIWKLEHRQWLGGVITLVMNGAFAYWVWVTVDVWVSPHRWRERKYVTSSLGTWTAFTSLEIWISVMLGIYNLGGTILIAFAMLITLGTLESILRNVFRIRWFENMIPNPSGDNSRRRRDSRISCLAISGFFVSMVVLVVWPLIACTASPPRRRVYAYPSRCFGGWDFRAVLDGRIFPEPDQSYNLTKGKVEIWDTRTNAITASFLTDNFVNTTWARTEENILLKRTTDPPTDRPFVTEVALQFPYIWTDYEAYSWVTLPDIPRTRNGNYTATLSDPVGNSTRTISGEFPYLVDNSGLRLDNLGLIPDVQRSWRSMAYDDENCPWGPDAKLLENTDPTAREIAGDGHTVLQTDMTKFGRCAELTVCANRRKQNVNGLDYAQGEEGLRIMDELLVVPLGILLVEQIRFGSCCGDGWDPYKAPAA